MHDKSGDVTLVHLIYAICVIMSVPLYGLVKRMSGRDKCKIAQFKMARSHVGIFIWKSAFCQFEHVSIELWPSLLKRKHLCSTSPSICCQCGLWMISFIKLKRAIPANQIAFNQPATWCDRRTTQKWGKIDIPPFSSREACRRARPGYCTARSGQCCTLFGISGGQLRCSRSC